MSKKITLRSSAAEYLTFIAATGEGGVDVVYADENIWLSQKMMGALYSVDVRTISDHLQKIFNDNELEKDSVIRKFRITESSEFEKYRIIQDQLFESDFDRIVQNPPLTNKGNPKK